MRLPALLCSDLHLTDQPATEYRWGLFPWLAEQIKTHHVKTLLCLGDLTDAKDYHSAELTNRIVKSVADLPIGDIKILAGNHDWLKRGHEYFRFLNRLPNAAFITEPMEDPDVHGVATYYLPYSKNPAKDWVGRDFSHYNYLFLHQTVKGAVASNGQTMEGEPLPALNAGRVFSGDIHVPQNIGGLTYVGSPYHVHFGDNFKPRCILIDRHGRESDLHFETIKRVSVKVEGLRQLRKLAFRAGDQVKVTLTLTPSEGHDWSRIKREAIAILTEAGVNLQGFELNLPRASRRVLVGGTEGQGRLTPPSLIWDFVNREELGGDALEVAMEVLGS